MADLSNSIDERPGGLLAWQRSDYPSRHSSRATLLVHALTNPLFLAGNLLVLSSPLTGWKVALGGLAMTLTAFGLQGVMHKRVEPLAPLPSRSLGDLVARAFAEQWVTFPRFVLSGAFGRAWRGSARTDG